MVTGLVRLMSFLGAGFPLPRGSLTLLLSDQDEMVSIDTPGIS